MSIRTRRGALARRDLLTRLDECRDYAQIDWQSVVNRIRAGRRATATLSRSSRELQRLTEELHAVQAETGKPTPEGMT